GTCRELVADIRKAATVRVSAAPPLSETSPSRDDIAPLLASETPAAAVIDTPVETEMTPPRETAESGPPAEQSAETPAPPRPGRTAVEDRPMVEPPRRRLPKKAVVGVAAVLLLAGGGTAAAVVLAGSGAKGTGGTVPSPSPSIGGGGRPGTGGG